MTVADSRAGSLADRLGLIGTPAFETRCFMLDVSRDRVPTMETLHWLVDVLAALRYSELQLYVEHTFAFAGHDTVWRHASPLTAAEVEDLARHASAAGIDLVANLNAFGHMERWLRHDAYLHRAECPDGQPEPLRSLVSGPSCLAPTPENAAFALSLARELLVATGGCRVMIGGDEPFELGCGVSSALAAEIGRDELYRTHLGRIIGPLAADGHEVLFWGDQFRRDPQAVEWIPDGAVCVVWNYEAPREDPPVSELLPASLLELFGLPPDAGLGFSSHARLALASGKPTWLACGTSTWNTFIGRNNNAAANIDDAATVGADGGAAGFMLADWGDNGHWQPLAVSLPSIVRGAVAAWTGRAGDEATDVAAAVEELIGAPAPTGALIDELGRISESIGTAAFNGSAPFRAAMPSALPMFGELDRDAAHAAIGLLRDARRHFAAHQACAASGARCDIVAQEMDAACGATVLGLRRLLGEQPSRADCEAVIEAQRAAWLRSSRPGGLADSLARFAVA